jgi:hypothetical protein
MIILQIHAFKCVMFVLWFFQQRNNSAWKTREKTLCVVIIWFVSKCMANKTKNQPITKWHKRWNIDWNEGCTILSRENWVIVWGEAKRDHTLQKQSAYIVERMAKRECHRRWKNINGNKIEEYASKGVFSSFCYVWMNGVLAEYMYEGKCCVPELKLQIQHGDWVGNA